MDTLILECLRCGHPRVSMQSGSRTGDAGECPRCRYVGWARSSDLSERTRRLLRDLPVDARLRIRAL